MTDIAAIPRKKKVLVVGAGFRAKNNFMPAFAYLNDHFEIVGVVATSSTRVRPLCEVWGVPAFLSLQEIDLNSIDIVAISVPTHQNAKVLKQLLDSSSNLSIIIDTPVAWKAGEYMTLAPLLRKFRSVTVTEDFMHFPQFALAREAASTGKLGKLQSVSLFNTGYRYHGLALIRSFINFKAATGGWRKRIGKFSSIISYSFADGYRGLVVGPYRQETTGGIVVEGSEGILSEAAEDATFADVDSRKFYAMTRIFRDGTIRGFEIPELSLMVDLPEIEKMLGMPFDDKSELNLLKNCGLMKIFLSLVIKDAHELNYTSDDAFYDSFASRLAMRGLFRIDPFITANLDFMMPLRVASNLRSFYCRQRDVVMQRIPAKTKRVLAALGVA